MPSGQRRTAVIIGGGFGGLSAAKRLADTDVNVILIDRNNHHLFQPLLYQVATAALSPGDVAQPLRSILRQSTNVHVMMSTVLHVDVDARRVVCDDGIVAYDHLILAPGARHSYFGHDVWERYAPGLKDLSDALRIRERLLTTFEEAEGVIGTQLMRSLLTFVIVGAGPTGVELAGAIAEIAERTMLADFPKLRRSDIRVILVQASPRILESFVEPLSASAQRSLEELGVEVLLNTSVTDVTADGVRLGVDFIPSRNVIWAAGNCASPLLADLGTPLDVAGRAVVEADCSLPGYPDVYVIGDAARFQHTPDARPLPSVAQPAMQMGRYVADIIRRNVEPGSRKPFRYRDLGSMATIGRARAIVDLGFFRSSGLLAWLMWAVLHVMQLISFRNRFKVMIEWAWYYISFQPGARLIINKDAPQEIRRWMSLNSNDNS
jgi:NADH:ubiquinone reductase (H+-translocating)